MSPIKKSVLLTGIVTITLCLCASCSKSKEQANAALHQERERRHTGNATTGPLVRGHNPVESIGTLDELISIVEGTPGKLLVFDLYADWCKPCKILAPTFSAIAGTHAKNARFFRIDVDRSPDIASAFRVRGMPLVVFMKDKEVVHSLLGLNPRENYERVITLCGSDVPAAECRTKLQGSL